MAAARREFHRIADEQKWSVSLFRMVRSAVDAGDLDGAAEEILGWYPVVETDDLEQNGGRRHVVRLFVDSCIRFLECSGSIGHPLESAVDKVMWDIAGRAEDALMADHRAGFKRVKHLRAIDTEATRITEKNRSLAATSGSSAGLPRTVRRGAARRLLFSGADRVVRERIRRAESAISSARSGNTPEDLVGAINELVDVLSEAGLDQAAYLRAAVALAEAALVVNDTHDDPGVLREAADRLGGSSAGRQVGSGVSSLVYLLRAWACLTSPNGGSSEVKSHFASAEADLRRAAANADRLTLELLPDIHATLARLAVNSADSEALVKALDRAVEECHTGRRRGLRPWRRATAADTTLARFLVWSALQDRTDPARQVARVREAIRLSRRQCRPWHGGGAQARLALNEALCARDALSGGVDMASRMEGWHKAAARAVHSSTADRARLAAAWVAWAVDTDDADIAAEAYHHLISIVPLDAATRYRSAAKDKVLAAAQEHTEEAGYWLARAGRFRDAVVALETGRAVKLSEIAGWDRADLADLLAQAGESALAEQFRAALQKLDAEESRPSGSLSPSSSLQRAWAEVRTASRRIAAVTGVDPLALNVNYDDITAATGDGPLLYIAAAKAGGYALVVAARHDPQFVDLPRFDRASIAGLLEAFLPGADEDADERNPLEERMLDGLRWLWANGMQGLMHVHARGPIVTLIPVGLLGLVPLHTVGGPGWSIDGNTEWLHAGHFSVLRYAPNARTLRRCRDTVERLSGAPLSLLAADAPDVPGAAHLKYADVETAEVVRLWNDPKESSALWHSCTWADFRAAAEDYAVWHLACHGMALPDSILDSTLHFTDTQVTLHELRARLRPAGRRLAVLSACESHLVGTANPNEAIGLPSALLQLGFAGVIAAAWPITDRATTYLMACFYRLWRHGGLPPAVALNRAQQWLRHATCADLAEVLPALAPRGRNRRPFADPRFWAAFTYTGV